MVIAEVALIPARRTIAVCLWPLLALCLSVILPPRAGAEDAEDPQSFWRPASPSKPTPDREDDRPPVDAPATENKAPVWLPRRPGGAIQRAGTIETDRGPILTAPKEQELKPKWLPRATGGNEDLPSPRRLPEAPAAPLTEEQAVLLGAARNAASRRQWDQAIQRYEEYFRRFGTGQLDVRREYAGILVQAGRTRQALEVYQQLLVRDQGDEQLRLVAADVAILHKDYKLAVALLLPVVQRQPNNVEAANRLTRAFLFDDDFPRAWQVFEQHLAKLRPGDETTPRTFPALLVDLERSADAIAFLRPILEKKPLTPNCWRPRSAPSLGSKIGPMPWKRCTRWRAAARRRRAFVRSWATRC